MESDIQNPVRSEGNGRRLNGEEMQGGGSVRRARQKAKADLPPEELLIGTPPPPVISTLGGSPPQGLNPNEISQISHQPSEPPIRSLLRPRLPSLVTPGLHFSSTPQWSQPYGNSFRPPEMDNPINEHMIGRGPPPQRPPRPNFVPSILSSDHSESERHQVQNEPTLQDQNQFVREDNLPSSPKPDGVQPSSYNRSPTELQRLHEFQISTVPPLFSQTPRRSANLGPPPSSRKGASMYYPQNSFVAPIPEEISEGHSSFASSHVIPTSWGDGPPDPYAEEGIEEEDEVKLVSKINENRTPKAKDHLEPDKILRKHSSRRRSRASSKEFFSADVLQLQNRGEHVGGIPRQDPISNVNNGHPSAGTVGPETGASAANHPRSPAMTIPGTAFLVPPSANTSPNLSPISPTTNESLSRSTTNASFITPYSGSRTPVDPRVHQILGSLERGGHYGASGVVTPFTSTAPSMSEKGPKRPPRLDIAATKSGEGRGSQSSLPELIRRATRLASNLDRGKTASRLGMLDVVNGSEKQGHGADPNSISDILAAFPSPSIGTPSGGRRSPRWASPIARPPRSRDQETMSDFQKNPRHREQEGRRCCGIPIWVFVLLIIVVILLIAAAVIIPVTLIILPKMRHAPPATLASCIKNYPCINGGTNLVKDNSCRCICVKGFSGSMCATAPDQSCTTMDVSVKQSGIFYRNATAATGIPRLLAAAYQNFSIPLDSEALLSLFSSKNLSCSDENHLITLNDKVKRRSLPPRFAIPHVLNLIEEPLPSPQLHASTPCVSHTLYRRDIPYHTGVAVANDGVNDANESGAVTSNNILLAAPTGAQTVIPVVNTDPVPQPTASKSFSPSSSSLPEVPQKAYDFARTVILFIMQEQAVNSQDQALNSAVAAQSHLQTVLEDLQSYNVTPVSAGGKIMVDFGKFTVDLGNGTIFGNGLSNL